MFVTRLHLVTFFSFAVASGCGGTGGFANLQESHAAAAQKQDQILERLAAVEAKLDAKPVAAPEKKAAPKRANRPDPGATYKVAVGDAYVKGPDDALVTIVEWSDFQCPFCNRVNPTMAKIREAYGDQVRVAFKHNPLPMHNRAMAAALAAEAAGKQGKFWEMHDKLFANGRGLTDENIAAWAAEMGLDLEQFEADRKDKALEKKVLAQQAEGIQLGARGTPSFFVNGRYTAGAKSFEDFKALIDEELAEAQKIAASGVPAKEVYGRVIKSGRTEV